MARRKVEAVELACDGCGALHYEIEGEPVHGISINWTEIAGTGGWGGQLWACKEACAVKALRRRNKIEEESRR